MIFLQETKVTNSYFYSQNFKFGFYDCLVVDCVGQSGGLVLLWKREIDLEVICYSDNCIHSRVRDTISRTEWMLFRIYGLPKVEQRKSFWDLIRSLGRGIELPWLVYRYFNEVLFHHEKKGGRL